MGEGVARSGSERALEERCHDGLHAVRLVLGEGPVELLERVLREGADDYRRDASVSPERSVQDEDLDLGAGLRGIEPAAEIPPPYSDAASRLLTELFEHP